MIESLNTVNHFHECPCVRFQGRDPWCTICGGNGIRYSHSDYSGRVLKLGQIGERNESDVS